MAEVVKTFVDEESFGQYLAQLDDAGLGSNITKYMIEGNYHILVGTDLPEADPLDTFENDNCVLLRDEKRLEAFLENTILPTTWNIKNKGGMYVYAGLDGIFITPAAQAVLARVPTATDIEKSAIIHFVNAEALNGNWALIDEFFSFGLEGANALVGWIAKTATNNGAVLSINGATFSGAEWIDSNYIPQTDRINMSLNNAMVGVFINEYNNPTDAVMGFFSVNTSNRLGMANFLGAPGIRAEMNDAGGLVAGENVQSNKLFVGARLNSSAQVRAYKDGVQLGTGSRVSTSFSTLEMYIGAQNNSGTASWFMNGGLYSFCWGGCWFQTGRTLHQPFTILNRLRNIQPTSA